MAGQHPMAGAAKTRLALLLPILLALLWPSLPGTAGAQGDPGQARALELQIDAIKHEFENQIQGVADQKQIAALALRAAGQAWMAAAAAADRNSELFDPGESLESFGTGWDEAGNSWADRESRALRLYFEAASRLTARLALQAGDKKTADDLALLLSAARSGLRRPQPMTVQALEAEAKVFWSNRLTALASIMGGLGARPGQRGELDDLVEDLLNRAEVVARRTDIHYQAKMELLYLNNAQSLTLILFLMAKADGSP
ncbi:MAG: hypothetical protein LBP92_07145, partial [Deltaproteobacteria bacterium]|nr:hypothetical protein [Deltaproteobacteria bacterium]